MGGGCCLAGEIRFTGSFDSVRVPFSICNVLTEYLYLFVSYFESRVNSYQMSVNYLHVDMAHMSNVLLELLLRLAVWQWDHSMIHPEE